VWVGAACRSLTSEEHPRERRAIGRELIEHCREIPVPDVVSAIVGGAKRGCA
jgi:hypothetical protein